MPERAAFLRNVRRILGRCVGPLVVVATVMATAMVGLAGAASAAAPPWGACGTSTAENKVVRQFYVNPRTYYTLYCGGPLRSSDPRYGYRHILKEHKADFERNAAGTGQNWRDLADLVMDTLSRDPDSAKPANDGQACLSREMFLYNTRTNQLVRKQIFRMFVQLEARPGKPANSINTAFSARAQC